MGKPSMEVHLAKASAREPASHVENSRKGNVSLSPKVIKTTKPLDTSVVVTIMWQRSVGPRNF